MKRYACALVLLLASGCDAAPAPRQAAVSRPVETRGLDSAILADTVAQAHRLPRLRSLLVLRDGQVLAEQRFNGGPPLDRPVNIKSASKSVLSALVGIAIAKGALTGVDQPVLSVLGSDAPPNSVCEPTLDVPRTRLGETACPGSISRLPKPPRRKLAPIASRSSRASRRSSACS